MQPEARAPAAAVTRPAPPAVLPYAAMGVGVLALGLSAILVRWAAAPGPVTGLYRMGLASLFLTPFVLLNRRRRAWPRAGWQVALLGGALLSLDLAAWNTAVNITTAANATLFANTAPLWVALAARLLFGERLSGRFWSGLWLTLAGVAAVLGSDFLAHPDLGWGDLLALGAGVFYAGYYLCTQIGRRTLDPLAYVWLAGLASTVSLLTMSTGLGLPLTGYPPQTYLAFLGLALITQVGGYVAVGYALGHLPAAVVAPTMVGQPVVTALLAIPLLGESLSLAQWLGGAAVIAGVLIVHRAHGAPVASG